MTGRHGGVPAASVVKDTAWLGDPYIGRHRLPNQPADDGDRCPSCGHDPDLCACSCCGSWTTNPPDYQHPEDSDDD